MLSSGATGGGFNEQHNIYRWLDRRYRSCLVFLWTPIADHASFWPPDEAALAGHEVYHPIRVIGSD